MISGRSSIGASLVGPPREASNMPKSAVLEVDRATIGRTRLQHQELPELVDGAVRLRIDRFAVTANNISTSWMTVEHATGPDEVQQTWAQVHDGAVAPNIGRIASMQEDT
jgi:hypothetical protein